MMKKILDYFRMRQLTEKAVYIMFGIGLVFVIILACNTKINIKTEINVGDYIVDTSYYDLADHVEILNPSKILATFDQDVDTILFGDSYTLEQQIFFYDMLASSGLQMDNNTNAIDPHIKHKTKFYFIHCTASKYSAQLDGEWFTNFFHNERGWSRVGYSAIILHNGKLDTLSPFNLDGYTSIDEFTYGVRGVNMQSLHFAYVGGIDGKGAPMDSRTIEQKETMMKLIQEIRCSDPDAVIIGHRDHPNVAKACPSFDVREYYK